jgi:hypothetical protein
MSNIDAQLTDLLSTIEDSIKKRKSPKVKDLAPIFGPDAILFQMKYGAVFNNTITLLPCGCIYYHDVNEYKSPVYVYMSVCPAHQLMETVRNSFIV